jgi:hypothetical protein
MARPQFTMGHLNFLMTQFTIEGEIMKPVVCFDYRSRKVEIQKHTRRSRQERQVVSGASTTEREETQRKETVGAYS